MSDHLSLAERWAEESREHPGMSKDTFVENYLFTGHGLDELLRFLKEESDLHGRVFESTSISNAEMLTRPAPEHGDGAVSYSLDLSKPHVVLRIQVEVATDGHGRIRPKPWWGPSACDDDDLDDDDDWNAR